MGIYVRSTQGVTPLCTPFSGKAVTPGQRAQPPLEESHRPRSRRSPTAPQAVSTVTWVPPVQPVQRGCRASMTANKTATWAATAATCTNFCSHKQSSFGYGQCMAVSSDPMMGVNCPTTAECVTAHLEGKPAESFKSWCPPSCRRWWARIAPGSRCVLPA
jgi:hypothetical protein